MEKLSQRQDVGITDLDEVPVTQVISSTLADPTTLAIVTQPIVSLDDGGIVGYEALARFAGGIPTEQLFIEASELGLGAELEAIALQRGLATLRFLPYGFVLHVNVSPIYLGMQEIHRTLMDAPLHRVVIELTEHIPVSATKQLRRQLATYRSLGARIALDDAGAGYGGLELMYQLEPDMIKVDRFLIGDINYSDTKASVVATLVNAAQSRGIKVVAEGIETRAEFDTTSRLGIDFGQGYWIARPASGLPRVDSATLSHSSRKERNVTLGRELAEVTESVTTALGSTNFPNQEFGVGVDQYGRPLFVWSRGADGVEHVRNATEVECGSSVSECLRRGIARGVEARFDPLVVTDHTRRVLGIVRLERLLNASQRRQGLEAS
ncbi:EAL domain-containing protein [Ferrimicrobium sp.]|uniref:EAL domain-containing protein n=1 Tax=Ferrimicrobium sp. TaxID=2926050 RepID=UPI00262CA3AC|nr:EAL domain-containing protein [Ferrimicrobium sp.]